MIISIEGNIGSGKTTLLSELKKRIGEYLGRGRTVVYVREPVDEWLKIKDEEQNTMLDLLYKDPKTHAFAFQMMAFITRLNILKKMRKENPDAILITERCLHTDSEVFAKMLKENKDMSLIHWKIYDQWSASLSKEWKPDLVVYVRSEPETSIIRVKKRGRESEKNITLEYLKMCHNKHEDWMKGVDSKNKIIFDANKEFIGKNGYRVDELVKILKQRI